MKRHVYIVTIILSFFFLTVNAYAQFSELDNYVTRTWTSSDGLPSNTISDVIQSPDGFMYFGSYEALVRFDGYEFETINKYTMISLETTAIPTIIGANKNAVKVTTRRTIYLICTLSPL